VRGFPRKAKALGLGHPPINSIYISADCRAPKLVSFVPHPQPHPHNTHTHGLSHNLICPLCLIRRHGYRSEPPANASSCQRVSTRSNTRLARVPWQILAALPKKIKPPPTVSNSSEQKNKGQRKSTQKEKDCNHVGQEIG